MLLAGIGGTGIVTVGAILSQAAQLDGISASILDLTGITGKYAAVMSHLHFMPGSSAPASWCLGTGKADLVIGCDLIVSAGQEALSKMAPGRTFAVVNTAFNPTFDFTKMLDWSPSVPLMLDGLRARTGGELHALDASRLATARMRDVIGINILLVGYAWA